MTQARYELLSFNRGRISDLALARTDFKRTALSSEVQTNWLPRALGSMMLRPGLGYTGGTRSDAFSVTLPFIFSKYDTARLELTAGKLRVWVNDVLVSRPLVTASITNGSFDSDLTGWSDESSGSAVATWATGGFAALSGTGTADARIRQTVTVAQTEVVHALNIVVDSGPVRIRVGSTAGADDYVAETVLGTGYHSLAFTPSGNFTIDLFNYADYAVFIDSIAIASVGTMELTTPWTADDLREIRWDQSGDIVFCACPGYRQRQIERRPNGSWSIVEHYSNDGPFRVQNVGPITIAPSAASGDITLTASANYFRPGHVGALFRLEQTGQSEEVELTAEAQFSDPIRITGVDSSRIFSVIITGTWTGTITLQYSVGAPGDWVDAVSGSYTSNVALSYDDTLDNQIIFYRIGIKAGNYGSGTATALLAYSSGAQRGIARVTGYTSPTQVSARVLESFGNTTATPDWWESYWSAFRGFPSAVAFYEGRLWFAGKDHIWGSVSDSFFSHDDTIEGDSGPISRSIGSGPVDVIGWLSPLQRLLIGAEGEVRTARSSSFDEPLTPGNFNLKGISTDGAEGVNVVKVDTSAVFVSGVRVYEAAYDSGAYDYGVSELSQLVPEIGEPGIVRLAIQHKPEKRVHAIRSDGTVALLIFDKQEQVSCWVDVETDGIIEDCVVEPGLIEDKVTYTVARTIGGVTKRFHERWATEAGCRGFPEARLADSYAEYSGAATTTITGLSHLEGREVVCWGWNTATPFTNAEGQTVGRDMGTFTVSGGQITGLASAVTNAVVGLSYDAVFKSTKLAFATEQGTSLCGKKKIAQLGIIARWIHAAGLQYGPSLDYMDDLPQVESGADVAATDVREVYDEGMFQFPGEWDTDSRLWLKAQAPRPVTLLAAVMDMEGYSK